MKRVILLIIFLIILTFTACSENSTMRTGGEPSATVSESTSTPANESPTVSNSEVSTSTKYVESNDPTESPEQTISSKVPDSTGGNNNNQSAANNKTTNPPAISKPDTTTSLKPSTSSQPPATSTPIQPPTTSEPNPSAPPQTSAPPNPSYEIMGQDFLNEVLSGINERRAAWGLTPARLDSSLSSECLVQAKKMADAGYAFHSEMSTGCEGTARVPYNHPADLLGDVMCTHVPDFLYEKNVRIGVAVVRKGNYLYAVVQGAP